MMKKVLVFGGSGLVGSHFVEVNSKNFEIKAPATSTADILKRDQISKAIEEFNPQTVINFAAYTNVEEAESQKDDKAGAAYQINVLGAKNVAEECMKGEKSLIHISTEYVFDGTKQDSPYVEEDIQNPINWYGMTKYLGEKAVLESGCKGAIVRLSMPYSPFYELKKDVARFFFEQLKNLKPVQAIEDQYITPTLVSDISEVIKVLLEANSSGFYHISSTDSVTPLEFVKTLAETFHLDYSLISSIKLDKYNQNKKAKLLKYSWLNPTKFEREFGEGILHTVEEGLQIFKNQI